MEISEIDDDRIDSILDAGDFTAIEAIQMAYELKERRKADRPQQAATAPCVSCGKMTEWACADCRIDTGKGVRVCEQPVCRMKHEKTGCTRPAPPEVSNG